MPLINNNLIKSCTCGNVTDFQTHNFNNDIDTLMCTECLVIHQVLPGWDAEKYFNFYATEYHRDYQKNRGTMTYEERYEHDCRVAQLRLAAYKDFLKTNSYGLDIGSSNSAFVHEAIKLNYTCLGLEPGKDIGDDAVTVRGTLETVQFNNEQFDWVTMHDSIEHMIDVNSCFKTLYQIIKNDGKLILDLPDYFVLEGKHHWKKIEHLWLFSRNQFASLIEKHNFKVEKITTPIPGKLVFYCTK